MRIIGKIRKAALTLGGVAMLGTMFNIPVNAAENSTASVSETWEVTGEDTKECEVDVEVAGSGFTITIPKKIVLAGNTMTAQYEVTVKGDISGSEVVKVVPEEFFNMTQPPKDAVKTGVLQQKTEFNMTDLAKTETDSETGDETLIGTTVTGDVFADGRDLNNDGNADVGKLSAGTWEGVFVFAVSVEEVSTTTQYTEVNLTSSNIAEATNITVDSGAGTVVIDGLTYSKTVDGVTTDYKITSIASNMWDTTSITSITFNGTVYTTTDGTNTVDAFNQAMIDANLNTSGDIWTVNSGA